MNEKMKMTKEQRLKKYVTAESIKKLIEEDSYYERDKELELMVQRQVDLLGRAGFNKNRKINRVKNYSL